jgi:site-specific DNA recombinase
MESAAFIYCRISQDRNGAGLGVSRQEEDCRKLAVDRGLTVARVFVDNDISAYSGTKRPAYSEMLAALELGEASVVLCWHTDSCTAARRNLRRTSTSVRPTGSGPSL